MKLNSENQYIKSVRLNKNLIENMNIYPFNLPILKNLDKLNLHPNVTFIIGENGSGKSTLLEAIAVRFGFNPEGGTKNFCFSTYNTHSELSEYISLSKGFGKPKRDFFLRAESFYNVATAIENVRRGVNPDIIKYYGGVSLHEQSHGESFFSLFLYKFEGNGIYILDEPEAALSPMRQMSFLIRLNELVNQGCQFIIATHSPIIMSYPNATIYEIKDGKLSQINCDESEHFQLAQDFLNNKEAFFRHLFEE